MNFKDISTELWRDYDFNDRIYRIDNPIKLYIGSTTHRIVDSTGLVHCVPSPGYCGCIVRWKSKDESEPVKF